jgi:hypothetical protein
MPVRASEWNPTVVIKRVDFGAEPVPYIREKLTLGHKLAEELLKLPLEAGSVHALLPEETAPEDYMDFEEGSVSPTTWVSPQVQRIDRKEIDEAEALFIRDYLAQDRSHVAVFEDPFAEVGNAFLEGEDYFTDGKQIYYVLTSDDLETERIIQDVRAGSALYALGVLTSWPGFALAPGQQIPDEAFRSISLAPDHILIGAYDGEADLIWSRGPK